MKVGTRYIILDNKLFRKWCKKYIPHLWNDSWNRQQAVLQIDTFANSFEKHLDKYFLSHKDNFLGLTLTKKKFEKNWIIS